MTEENRRILTKINAYAEKVLGDIDPQKTPISYQLEQLKPVMEEIAKEQNMSLQDVFILYMDLASEAALIAEQQLQSDIDDNRSFSNIANMMK